MTRASMTLFWFSLTILVSLGLYHTSYRVEDLGRQLRSLNVDIEAEQRNIHVLKAEWVYLSNPARIENAARKHLDLKPTTPQQITRLEKISGLVAPRSEALATASAPAKPIASLEPRTAAHKPKAVAEESGRINTHLVMQKSSKTAAATAPAPSKFALRLVEDSRVALATAGDEP